MTTKLLVEAMTYSLPLLLLAGLVLTSMWFTALDNIHRLFFCYLSMALLVDILSRFFGIFLRNNLLLIPLFGLLELGFFTVLYWRFFLQKQPRILLIVPLAALGFIVWETSLGSWLTPERFHAYSRVVDPIAVVFMCMLHFREIGDAFPVPAERMRLNSGILLFFSLNMVFFLPVNFLINVPAQLKFWFWLANFFLTLLFYAFLIREIWKNGKTQRSLQAES